MVTSLEATMRVMMVEVMVMACLLSRGFNKKIRKRVNQVPVICFKK
jgi:hypothetical protein